VSNKKLRPMNAAPKDGRQFIMWVKGSMHGATMQSKEVFWNGAAWQVMNSPEVITNDYTIVGWQHCPS